VTRSHEAHAIGSDDGLLVSPQVGASGICSGATTFGNWLPMVIELALNHMLASVSLGLTSSAGKCILLPGFVVCE